MSYLNFLSQASLLSCLLGCYERTDMKVARYLTVMAISSLLLTWMHSQMIAMEFLAMPTGSIREGTTIPSPPSHHITPKITIADTTRGLRNHPSHQRTMAHPTTGIMGTSPPSHRSTPKTTIMDTTQDLQNPPSHRRTIAQSTTRSMDSRAAVIMKRNTADTFLTCTRMPPRPIAKVSATSWASIAMATSTTPMTKNVKFGRPRFLMWNTRMDQIVL